jgi:serine/threonine protein kinase
MALVPKAPYFLAPEVFEEMYSFKADVWSVGCVVIQMVTGTPPWKDLGISNPVALYNHVKAQTGPPKINLSSDDDFEAVTALKSLVARCFRQAPDERPSARELLEESFFHEYHHLSDEEMSTYSRGLFSPASACSWDQTPTKGSASPARFNYQRRRSHSIGTPASPLLSPPLPQGPTIYGDSPVTFPQADTKDWPSWAREQKEAGLSNSVTTASNSLQYSLSHSGKKEGEDGPTTATSNAPCGASSSLAGMRFIELS